MKKICANQQNPCYQRSIKERKMKTTKHNITNKAESIKSGYKKTPVGIIPEDWEVKRIKSVADVIGGGTPSTTELKYWNGNINWFTPSEIKGKFVSKSERKITKAGLKNSSAKELPIGTILLTTRATIGEVSLSTEISTTNQGFQSLVCKNGTNNVFLYELIKFNKNELYRRANGSTFLEISGKEVRKIPLAIPPLPEQKAIADCLSTWDKGIEKLSALIASKKEQKKGLMQQIFNGQLAIDNEQLPVEIRLKKVDKEEELLKGWKEAKLEQVSKIIMGVSPNSENYNVEGQGKFLIQGNADIRNRKSAPRQYTSEITKECQVGDILMSVRAPVGEIAESIHNACIGRGVCAIRNNKKADGKFLFYYLLNTEVL